ncbi:protein-L-isoaspartate O-methyltransferase [Syncephalis pseudoplumigaleata]|uniref:Protein-L-isoaspartate O-methyltransferase n=1 Tax=Syncephalis pseudoplumigaleata TaxID=1712513 RepID=A0A4P9YTH2_9FUNG|nr:protein-L-isoaspartate O-methyltransferase [Syncephalis pseudoplumigaleata]|eukprot:RKP23217.1 protein-L-isoaspartate O-methyltransferase [Syncephalis pseudoplumigaleata]
MKQVDRANYAPDMAYQDAPQSIGYNATISAPHMHAYALEILHDYLQPGMKVLDVGSGSGYLVSCMAAMTGDTGKVIGVEHIDQLNEQARKNIKKDHPEYLHQGRVELITGDGRLGYAPEAPYDCIHVGAAASRSPTELLKQLKAPGRMFIPEGPEFEQSILQYDKDADGEITKRALMGVMYVPLTDREAQLGE